MHYLIVRPGAIGDNLLAFPVIQALRAQSANPHILFVGNSAVLSLALDTHIADEVADYNERQWSELFSTAGIRSPELQALLQHIDVVICWLRDPEHIVEHNLRSSGIRHIIIASGRPAPGERIHIIDYLARTLNLQLPLPFSPLHLSCDHTSAIDGPGRTRAAQSIAIHPGSGGEYKCWPVGHFVSLITTLWQRNIAILLLAGPADYARLEELRALLPSPPSPLLFETLIEAPLDVVARRLCYCRGYIGNDSGITHLAALLATPTIVLFGPSDPAIWRPYGSTTKVLYEPVLANLRVDTVLYTIEEFF